MPPTPKKLAALLLLLLLTAAVTVTAAFVIDRLGATGKVPDTAPRLKLLSQKGAETTASTALLSERSVLYSSNIYDIEVDGSFSGPLPWVSQVTPDPGGVNSFTWRLRLTTEATFSVRVDEAITGPFSIKLSDASGSPLYAATGNISIPAEEIRLNPGIYVLDAVSEGPLDRFEVDFKTHGPPTTAPFKLKNIHIEIDAFALKNFRRLRDLSLNSTDDNILKMAGGRVKARILDETGEKIAEAKIGLSGRSREHLDWFPSVDLKLDGGTFMGIPSFKLYRIDTKNGLLDLTFLSLYKDMGFMVPRQDVIKLFVNGEYKGLYILMETPGPAMFATQKLPEANILGIDTGKMFFDYPYGATLDERYFYRLKGPQSKKRGRRFFLSDDFTRMIDRDRFARFIAFASIYYAAHGLGVDDLRFYENPVTGLFYPLPRDMSPGVGIWSGFIVKSYLSHMAWLHGPPLYTIWPLTKPLRHDYTFDRSENLFEDADKAPFIMNVADIHFSVSNFVTDTRNLELTNRYLSHFSENEAMIEKAAARVKNTLSRVLLQEPSNRLLYEYLKWINKRGLPFLGDPLKANLLESGPYLTDGESLFFWNLRTSTSLKKDLMPSLLAPMRHKLDDQGWQNQIALNFLSERKIFKLLNEAGLELEKRSFKRVSGLVRKGAINLAPGAYKTGTAVHIPDDVPPAMNVATYLGTHRLSNDTALLVLLVRNATEDALDYRVVMRDGLTSYTPMVNTTFRLGTGSKTSTPLQIALKHLLRGEELRLLAFRLPLGKQAKFYSVSMPEKSWFLFPPYMYLPARAATVTKKPASPLPDGIVKVSGGYLIPENGRVEITGDLILPKGDSLRIGAGASITMHPGSSITVNGDLIVKGTRKRRVSFKSPDGRPWGGIYAGGSPSGNIEVVLENVDFADYGEFPKTRVGEKYLNGGITLYRANARIDGLRITGALGEDAINLISSTAFIRDTSVTGPFSDAIDLDFSTASIEGLRVEGARGDGLDLSVSLVEVRGSSFRDSGDKGISIGEMSTVYVKNSSFTGNAIAVANKDQSHLELSGTTFEGNGIALAEFIKKPYFAKPTSAAKDNTYDKNGEDYSWLGLRR